MSKALKRFLHLDIPHIFTSSQFNFLIIFVGIALRLKHFLENRPFWLDEAYTAVSITSRSIEEIITFKLIFFNQPQTPLFFTLIEKLSTIVFGNNEYSLRLFPLITGILSLFLFYNVLKHYVHTKAIPIALGLFSLSAPLIYYSAELKPYSGDVFVVLILYKLVEYAKLKELDIWRIRFMGALGSFLIWVSYPSMFVLAGMAITHTWLCIARRQGQKFCKLIIAYLMWLCSFILLYRVSLQSMVHYFRHSHGDAVMSMQNWQSEGLIWLKDSFFRVFENPVGLSLPLLAAFMFVIGCIVKYKKDKEQFLLLLSPFLLVWLAAVFSKYPFKGRMLLFEVPILLIFISEGVLFILNKSNKASFLAGILIVGMLFINPVKTSAYNFVHDRKKEENRAAVEFIKNNFIIDDFLIINSSAQFPYWYYVGNLHFTRSLTKEYIKDLKGTFLVNKNAGKIFDQLGDYQGIEYAGLRHETHVHNQDGLFRDSLFDEDPNKVMLIHKNMSLGVFKFKRAWVFLSHTKPRVKNFILDCLDRQGQRLKELELSGVSVILYEFNSTVNK